MQEYNATVEFYWAPFLVESNSDDPKIHSIQHRIIKADTIGAHAENWRGVDYLVFNTYMWWMNTLDMKVMYVRRFPAGKGAVDVYTREELTYPRLYYVRT